jgi:hypothetical protein
MQPQNHSKEVAILQQVELKNMSVLKETGIDAVERQLQQLEEAHQLERNSSRKSSNRDHHHTTETKKEKLKSLQKNEEENSMSDESDI